MAKIKLSPTTGRILIDKWRELIKEAGNSKLSVMKAFSVSDWITLEDLEDIVNIGKAVEELEDNYSDLRNISPRAVLFVMRVIESNEAELRELKEYLKVSPQHSCNIPQIETNYITETTDDKCCMLVKMQKDDPIALIIGRSTDSCLKFKDHGQQCLIDGLTLINNGFYLMIEAPKGILSLSDNGWINYA